MPIGVLLLSVILVSIWSLWTRRAAIHCRWEGSPTLLVVAVTLATYLISPHASRLLGGVLHSITGMWNFEDFLGHTWAITAACTATYMVLIRFGPDAVQQIYVEKIAQPAAAAVPVLYALFDVGQGGTSWTLGLLQSPPPTLMPYWILLAITLAYLWGFTLRALLVVRAKRASAVVNMYIVSTVLTLISIVTMCIHVLTPLDIHCLMWTAGAACAIGWGITPAYSWLQRSRPLDLGSWAPRVRRAGTP